MSPIVAASLAETRARSRLGIAIAAMIPMMATTIRSSMSVKPSLLAATVAFLIICQPSSRNRGGAPAPPRIAKTWTTLLQYEAGRADHDLAAGVARGYAGRGEADHAARVTREAADARLPDVDRGGAVHV